MFENGDLEHGAPRQSAPDDPDREDGGPVPNLIVVDSLKQSMEETIVHCCELLQATIGSDAT
jgi:hypothetical protein